MIDKHKEYPILQAMEAKRAKLLEKLTRKQEKMQKSFHTEGNGTVMLYERLENFLCIWPPNFQIYNKFYLI